jgi:hypothetical protein
VLATIFKGNENAVQGLVEAQLLSVWHNEPYRDANGVVQPAARASRRRRRSCRLCLSA